MNQSPHSRNTDTNPLARYLSNHDEPCPSCTYNLRGIGGTACPECNQPLRLIVSARFPRIGVFISGMIILACGLGLNLLLLIFGIVVVFILRTSSPDDLGRYFAFTVSGVVVCGFCMWWWLRLRSTLASRQPLACALALALCALVTIVCTVPIFIFVD